MTRNYQIKRRPEDVVTVYSCQYEFIRLTVQKGHLIHALDTVDIHLPPSRVQVCLAFCSIAGAPLDSSEVLGSFVAPVLCIQVHTLCL